MEPDRLLEFLHAIDDELAKAAPADATMKLYLIGRSVLILHFGEALATQDLDFVGHIGPIELEEKALAIFGKGTKAAHGWGIYLEMVPQGIPPVPIGYAANSPILPGDWKLLRPYLPEMHDFAVTKFKRFHRKDQEDFQFLCDKGVLTVAGLERSLDLAYAFAADEEEDPGRKKSY